MDMTKCERCKVAINPNDDMVFIEGNHVLCRECAIELQVSGTKQKET